MLLKSSTATSPVFVIFHYLCRLSEPGIAERCNGKRPNSEPEASVVFSRRKKGWQPITAVINIYIYKLAFRPREAFQETKALTLKFGGKNWVRQIFPLRRFDIFEKKSPLKYEIWLFYSEMMDCKALSLRAHFLLFLQFPPTETCTLSLSVCDRRVRCTGTDKMDAHTETSRGP